MSRVFSRGIGDRGCTYMIPPKDHIGRKLTSKEDEETVIFDGFKEMTEDLSKPCTLILPNINLMPTESGAKVNFNEIIRLYLEEIKPILNLNRLYFLPTNCVKELFVNLYDVNKRIDLIEIQNKDKLKFIEHLVNLATLLKSRTENDYSVSIISYKKIDISFLSDIVDKLSDYDAWKNIIEQKKNILNGTATIGASIVVNEKFGKLDSPDSTSKSPDNDNWVNVKKVSGSVQMPLSKGQILPPEPVGYTPLIDEFLGKLKRINLENVNKEIKHFKITGDQNRSLHAITFCIFYQSLYTIILDSKGYPFFGGGFPDTLLISKPGKKNRFKRVIPKPGMYFNLGKPSSAGNNIIGKNIIIDKEKVKHYLGSISGFLDENNNKANIGIEIQNRLEQVDKGYGVIVTKSAFGIDNSHVIDLNMTFSYVETLYPFISFELKKQLSEYYENFEEILDEIIKGIVIELSIYAAKLIVQRCLPKLVPVVNLISIVYDFLTAVEGLNLSSDDIHHYVACLRLGLTGNGKDDVTISCKLIANPLAKNLISVASDQILKITGKALGHAAGKLGGKPSTKSVDTGNNSAAASPGDNTSGIKTSGDDIDPNASKSSQPVNKSDIPADDSKQPRPKPQNPKSSKPDTSYQSEATPNNPLTKIERGTAKPREVSSEVTMGIKATEKAPKTKASSQTSDTSTGKISDTERGIGERGTVQTAVSTKSDSKAVDGNSSRQRISLDASIHKVVEETSSISRISIFGVKVNSYLPDVLVGNKEETFMRNASKIAQHSPSQSFKKVLQNGKFRRSSGTNKQDWEIDGRIMEAGHVRSKKKEGGKEYIILMSAKWNRRFAADQEHSSTGGLQISDEAFVIDGIAIHQRTA